MMIPAYYYAQQGADITLPVPAVTFGGWQKTEVPVDPAHTAVIVMHAWTVPSREESPGLYRTVEYLQRANKILEEKFPAYLEAVRRSGVRLIHVAAGFEGVLQQLPGYRRVCEKYPPEQYETISARPCHKQLQEHHWRLTGAWEQEYYEQIEAGYSNYGFAVMPRDEEDVVSTANQLFGLCREYEIEHLIYSGFAVNACLSLSPCGLIDMSRRGVMCSIVGDLTTAVENKESCETQRNREYGLWQFAVQSGFVFLSQDLMAQFPQWRKEV